MRRIMRTMGMASAPEDEESENEMMACAVVVAKTNGGSVAVPNVYTGWSMRSAKTMQVFIIAFAVGIVLHCLI